MSEKPIYNILIVTKGGAPLKATVSKEELRYILTRFAAKDLIRLDLGEGDLTYGFSIQSNEISFIDYAEVRKEKKEAQTDLSSYSSPPRH